MKIVVLILPHSNPKPNGKGTSSTLDIKYANEICKISINSIGDYCFKSQLFYFMVMSSKA